VQGIAWSAASYAIIAALPRGSPGGVHAKRVAVLLWTGPWPCSV